MPEPFSDLPCLEVGNRLQAGDLRGLMLADAVDDAPQGEGGDHDTHQGKREAEGAQPGRGSSSSA